LKKYGFKQLIPKAKDKFLISIIIVFAFLQSNTQTLDGYYRLIKRVPRIPPKESFYFYNDSNFRYQSHSDGLILVGEGTFQIISDTLVLLFDNCKSCRIFPGEVQPPDSAPYNWAYLKKVMPWGIHVWAIKKDTMIFNIQRQKENQWIFINDNAKSTYRKARGAEIDTYKKGYMNYFTD
jgi:hypothetical protein